MFLGYLLFFSGTVALSRKINRRLHKIPIITYHSISNVDRRCESRTCLDILGMEISKKAFEGQIQYISKRYNVIRLDQLIGFCNQNKELPPNPIVITFDDGFKNNYTNALPILEKYGCSATFFVIGNSVNDGIVWLHLLYQILDKMSGRFFNATFGRVINYQVSVLDDKSKIETSYVLKKALAELSHPRKIEVLKEICRQNCLDFEQVSNRGIYLDLNEIKDLHHNGHLLGAHSMRHDNLALMPRSLMKKEIHDSKKVIKEICGADFIPFSYPYGTKDSFNEEIKAFLKHECFGCAVTTIEGLAQRDSDLYELKRIEIGDFNKIELMAHLSGIIGDMKIILKKIFGR